MYAILGATGNIGSVIANALLGQGEKVRVVGRNQEKLQKFTASGAQAHIADKNDVPALAAAFAGVRAAFLMIPPDLFSPDYRAQQEQATDALASAVKQSGLQYAVNLSSIGAQVPSGTGPIAGLHGLEQKLNRVSALNVLHLRPAFFMENELSSLDLLRNMGIFGSPLKADLKMAMIATRDIGAYAAERLLKLDFSGKSTRELLGPRDMSPSEVAAIIGRAIGKAELPYLQFPYAQAQGALLQMGVSAKTAQTFIEMYQGFNDGIVVGEEPRSQANTTPTSFEQFAEDLLAPAYRGKAASA
ncbi:MAG: NmrA family NAD(P)-binding protein [Candidatus Acidiferrum sp.]|jgi:uncharacterized protein YbjT (DUF2867 family)